MTTKHTEGLPGSAQTDMESKRDELAENYSAATHPHGHSFCQVFDAVTAIHREEIAELQRKLAICEKTLKEECYCMGEMDYDGKIITCGCCDTLEKLREGKE